MRPHTLKRSGQTGRRILAALAAASVVSALLLPSPALGATSHAQPTVQTVVVVLAPFLTWDDVRTVPPGNLLRAASQSGVGNMNAITADPGWPTTAGGALTLGAGRWTAAPTDHALKPSELAAISRANANSLDPPVVGMLGSAIHAAGGRTAAVGCSDEDTAAPSGTDRPAALLAMDSSGTVDLDFTSPGLLARDASAPFGVRADSKQLRTAIRVALADDPALLVIDPGDLERAHDARNLTAEQTAKAHTDAVSALNDVFSDVQSALGGRRSLIVVLAPATDKPYYQPPYFAPIIVQGMDQLGELTSSSTHRPGIVTNLDFAPTILSALGIDVPASVVGQPMTSPGNGKRAPLGIPQAGGSATDEIARLQRVGTAVGSVDFVRDLIFIRFFAWGEFAIALLAAAIALLPRLRRLGGMGRTLIAFALSIPSGAWLMFLIARYPADPLTAGVAFLVATLATFAVVTLLARWRHSPAEMPVLALSTLTSLLILADQWTGRPFETGLFSYSVRAGWRYYGMGNEGAALLVGASILAAGLACDLLGEGRYARPARLLLMPTVGAVCLFTAASPLAGANAGVVLWGVVAYGIAWARVNRVRLGVKSALGMLAAILVLVGAFTVFDLLRGSAETHLGRFFADAMRGDFSAVGAIVYRKAVNNIGYITQTPYTWLALALAASLAAVRWYGEQPLARVLRERPGLSAALVGVVAGGVAAALTEDSGVVMPALMLFAGGLPVLYLALPVAKPR